MDDFTAAFDDLFPRAYRLARRIVGLRKVAALGRNDDEYTRGRDELLGRTVRRGDQLRRRRRTAWLGVAPLVLLLIGVPAALSLAGDRGGRTTVAASGLAPTTTIVGSAPQLAATGNNNRCRGDMVESTEGENVICRDKSGQVVCSMPLTLSFLTCPPDTSGITTLPPLPNRPPPPLTTLPPARPPTSAPFCGPGQLTMRPATTDKPVYRIGLDEILVQATAVNSSKAACVDGSGSQGIRIRDATGAEVGGSMVIGEFASAPPPIQPGDEFLVYMYWDQRVRGEKRASAGNYTVTLSFGQAESAPASFRLVAP